MSHSTLDPDLAPTGIFALFKGDTGSGKSVGALSFPKPYIFDHDRKMPAIAKKHFPKKEVHWDTFSDVFQIADQMTKLINYYPYESIEAAQAANYNEENLCPYETVISDTVTGLSYTALKSIDDVKGQNIISMLKNIKNTKAGGKMIEIRGYDYYNGEDNFLKWYIDSLKFLWARPGNPKHVIVCCHVLTSEQAGPPGTTIKTITRKIVTAGSKIAAYIPAQFDEVYHFATDSGSAFDANSATRHICLTQGFGDDSAKTAYNLPKEIDFTNDSLFDKISDKVDIGRAKTI